MLRRRVCVMSTIIIELWLDRLLLRVVASFFSSTNRVLRWSEQFFLFSYLLPNVFLHILYIRPIQQYTTFFKQYLFIYLKYLEIWKIILKNKKEKFLFKEIQLEIWKNLIGKLNLIDSFLIKSFHFSKEVFHEYSLIID